MPKVTWKSTLSDNPDEIKGSFYDGPTPPKGMYVVRLERLTLKTNSNGDDMFSGLLIVDDTRKSKKQYNGYGIWFNRNLTPAGERFVRNFVEAGLGVPWKTFREVGAITEDKDRPTAVVSIGKVKIERKPKLVVVCRRRRQGGDPDGDWELETDDFAPAFPGIDPKKVSDPTADEDDDDGDDSDDEEVDDLFDESEEDDDEEDEDEEDEEDNGAPSLEELKAMKLSELRSLADDEEIDHDGMKKPALVQALDAHYNGDEEDEDEDEEDEDEEEPPPPPAKKSKKSKR